jgi:hypothetical protein
MLGHRRRTCRSSRISLIKRRTRSDGVRGGQPLPDGRSKPYVYKPQLRQPWTKIINSVKDTHFARQVAKTKKGLLLGTENGICGRSTPAQLAALRLNLPDVHQESGGRSRPGRRHHGRSFLDPRQHRRAAPGLAGDPKNLHLSRSMTQRATRSATSPSTT